MSEVTLVLEDEELSYLGHALDDAIQMNEKILARPDLAIDDGQRMYCEELLVRYRYLQKKLNDA